MNPFATLHTLLSTDRLCNLISYSQRAPEGLMAEFGCYKGGSLEVLAKHNPERQIYGIDSFQGLPPASAYDSHMEGDFNDVDAVAIAGYFKMLYPNVKILKGFSPQVFEYFDQHARFGFVHVDVDLYYSVQHALDFFYPRMVEGGIMLFDDYGFTSTLGAKRALDDWRIENCPFGYDNSIHPIAKPLIGADGHEYKQYIIIK